MNGFVLDVRYHLITYARKFFFFPVRTLIAKTLKCLEWIGFSQVFVSKALYFLSFSFVGSSDVFYLNTVDIYNPFSEINPKNNVGLFVCSEPQFYYESKNLVYLERPIATIIVLEQSSVIGATKFVITNENKLIYELHYANKSGKFQYSDPAYFFNNDEKFAILCKKSDQNISCGIYLVGHYSHNYYHYLYEIISRLWILDKASIPLDVPLLIDDSAKNSPQLRDLINIFNKDNRPLIWLKRCHRYLVGKLYFVPDVNFIPPDYNGVANIAYNDYFFNTQALDFLRCRLLPRGDDSYTGKKIYISRKNTRSRRRCNEDEVAQVFLSHGFELRYPENLTVSEQISMFSGADFIAGVTGAAFTNLIFSQPGNKVLCLQSYVLDLSIFSTIAKYVEADFQYYAVHPKGYVPNDLHEKFTVDVLNLESVLVDFLRKKA